MENSRSRHRLRQTHQRFSTRSALCIPAALLSMLLSPSAGAGTFAYVGNPTPGVNSVSVYEDVNVGTLRKVIDIGTQPRQMVASPDGAWLWITGQSDNTVLAISIASNTVAARIGVGTRPADLAISPNGSQVYVANTVSNDLSVIDTTTRAVVGSIALNGPPGGIAFAPDGAHAYVVLSAQSNNVVEIDTGTRSITRSGDLNGETPVRIALNAGGGTAYVSSSSAGGGVLVVDVATLAQTRRITGLAGKPAGLVLSPDGQKLFVGMSNNVSAISAIDLGTFAVANLNSGGRLMVGDVAISNCLVYANAAGSFAKFRVSDNSLCCSLAFSPFVYTSGGAAVGPYGDQVLGRVGSGVGSITPRVDVAGGTSATLTVTPASGNKIDAITTDGCDGTLAGNSYTTAAVATPTCTVTANFLAIASPTCVSTANVDKSSSIRCSGIESGATLRVSAATCDPIVNGATTCTGPTSTVGLSPAVTVAIGGGVLTVNASQRFEVLGSVGAGSGGGSIDPVRQVVSSGTRALLTVSPNLGAHLTSVAGDTCAGSLAGTTYTTAPLVSDACTVNATFDIDTYAVSAVPIPPTGGTVVCTPDPVPYDGTTSCLANAGLGYTFSAFGGDCSGSTCTLTHVMRSPNVIANFTLATFPITATPNPLNGGTVSCTPNPAPYAGTATCTAVPNAGYVFDSFGVDCTGQSCTLSDIKQPQRVTANFSLAVYAITTSASPVAGGTVACAPDPVPFGASATCTATANAGYTFSGFSGDCSGQVCLFANVTRDLSVIANFVPITFAVTTEASPLSGGSVNCTPNPVAVGEATVCTAVESVPFHFVAFEGCTPAIGATCTISNLQGPARVRAFFALAVAPTPALDGFGVALLVLILAACAMVRRHSATGSGPAR